MRTVEVIVTSSGEVIINATGFAGSDCEKATAFLEMALGKLAAKERKPEFYQRRRRTHQQKIGL